MGHEKKQFPPRISTRQSRLDEQKVRKAVAALLAFHKKREETGKTSGELLLNESSQINIILSLWKIVGKKAKTFQITIPHTLRTPETEICLFTKDDNKMDSEASARQYQELLQDKGVTEVNEVMPLTVLKKEYKPFESRRQLSKRYDLFLADERIFRLLHAHLGKEFYKRKKYPATVDLTKKNLKAEILSAIDKTSFILTNRGNTNHVEVAHTGMTLDQVVENIMAAVQGVTTHIPMGWNNIKALYVRTEESVSLPIHTSLVFKEWVSKTKVVSTDVWRLKKQLEVTSVASPKGKLTLPTPEPEGKSKKISKRSGTKAATAEDVSVASAESGTQKRASKRKAPPAPEKEDPLVDLSTPPRNIIKQKPRKAATSLKKARETKKMVPGKLPAKSFSAKKSKRK